MKQLFLLPVKAKRCYSRDALEACDKVRYGKERSSLEIDQNEKRQRLTMSRATLL